MHRALAVALASIMSVPSGIVAQATPQADVWGTVQGLPPGTRLTLALSNGDGVTGTVVETTAASVVMSENEAGPTGFRTREGVSRNGAVSFERSMFPERSS